MSHIDFYYDVASPYTYVAATLADTLEKDTGLEVLWIPALLGGIYKATGNSPPASQLAAKAHYLIRDIARTASMFRVPLRMNSRFPNNSLTAMRALTVAHDRFHDKHRDYALALFRAVWTEDKDPSDIEVCCEIAKAVGVDPAAIREGVQDPAVKEALKKRTEEAVGHGAFGMPAFVLHLDGQEPEHYFGHDRMEMLRERIRRQRTWPLPFEVDPELRA